MTLPKRTTVLIVGAGPTGLTTAIALSKAGVTDFLIVDALKEGENSSRAMTVHAATLDSLDTLGCAKPLVQLGIQGKALQMNDRNNPSAPLVSIDFTTLKGSTKFPYVLILPQNITEKVLKEHLETQYQVQVQRPYKVRLPVRLMFSHGRLLTRGAGHRRRQRRHARWSNESDLRFRRSSLRELRNRSRWG